MPLAARMRLLCRRLSVAAVVLAATVAAVGQRDSSDADIARLRQALSIPLPADADSEQIVARRQMELELLTAESLGARGFDVSLMQFHLAGDRRLKTMAADFGESLKKFNRFIDEINRRIEQAQGRPEQAILGLPEKLGAVAITAELRRADLRRIVATALRRSDKARATAELAEAAAEALRCAEGQRPDEPFSLQCRLTAGLALTTVEPKRALALLGEVAEAGTAGPLRRMQAAFAMCWTATDLGDLHAAGSHLERFVKLGGDFAQAADNEKEAQSRKLSLDIYKAVLVEKLYHALAAEETLSAVERRRSETLAARALEKLFQSYPDHHAALAQVLVESFSVGTRTTRSYPALHYARALVKLKEGKLAAAAAEAQPLMAPPAPGYLGGEALWRLAAGAHMAAEADAVDADARDARQAQAAQLYDSFARLRPDDPRAERAADYALLITDRRCSGREVNDPVMVDFVARLEAYIASPREHRYGDYARMRLAEIQATAGQVDRAIDLLDGIAPASGYGPAAECLKVRLLAEQAIAAGDDTRIDRLIPRLAALASLLRSGAAKADDETRVNVLIQARGAELTLARLKMSRRRYDQALAACQAVANEPDVDALSLAEAILIRTDCLLRTDRLAEAADTLAAAGAESLAARSAQAFQTAEVVAINLAMRLRYLIADGADKRERLERAVSLRKIAALLNSDAMTSRRQADPTAAARCRALLAEADNEIAARPVAAPAPLDDRSDLDARMAAARALWLAGRWPQAVAEYHNIINGITLGDSEQMDANWWLAQALLARCVYENTPENPTERRRLAIRLRQLRLRDPNLGNMGALFNSLEDQINARP